MLEILQKLIVFKTTEDNSEEITRCYEYIASLFNKAEFDIQMFEKNGKFSQLISRKGSDALHPKVLLNGHIDIVPAETDGQYQLQQEGDKLTGRGTLDMKGMVAVMIEVMRQSKGDVALLLNGDEEIGGPNGAAYMVKEIGLKPEFVICPDGGSSEPWQIINKEKGILWLELKAKGKSAHGAYLWEGENALDKVMGAVQKIREFVGEVEPDAWNTTVNVAKIETSNTTPNKVPADATAILDIRFTEQIAENSDELRDKIQKLVPEIQVKSIEQSGLFLTDENNPFVKTFRETAERVLDREVTFTHAHGAADIRYFGEIGVPGVLFGAIGGGMHAADEWVSLQSLENNRQIISKFLSAIL